MKTPFFRLAAPISVCGLLSLVCAVADINIPVNNASFETLPVGGLAFSCGLGCSYSEFVGVNGWLVSPGSFSGQFQPGTQDGTTTYFSTLDDGLTSAFSNGGTISQTVGTTVVTGAAYRLTVDIGHRNDQPAMGTADLFVNGNFYPVLPDPVTSPPTTGGWATYTATYTGLAADAGDAMTIQLNSFGSQGNFDNIVLTELTSTATPEPSFFLLTGACLAGLGLFALRKRSLMRS